MWRCIKLLLAAVAVMTVLCSGAWAETYVVPDDLRYAEDDDYIRSQWTTGEYVVSSSFTAPQRLTFEIEGDVTLRINDGCSFVVNSCIVVPEGSSLTIEGGQDVATAGRLEVNYEGRGAAIGGVSNSRVGKITINGGTVIANASGDGAAIGCGVGGSGGELVVNGGTVKAYATGNGAGIGGGVASDRLKLRNDQGGQAWIVATNILNVNNIGFSGVIFIENSYEVNDIWERPIQFVVPREEGDGWMGSPRPPDYEKESHGYFFGRVYGDVTIKGGVEFPEIPKFAADMGLLDARWMLHIPKGRTLEIAPGATLEMQGNSFIGKTTSRKKAIIQNEGSLVINGILRCLYLGPIDDEVYLENMTGSGIVEQWGTGTPPVFRYFVDNFADNFNNRAHVYTTTVEAADDSPGCSGSADPTCAVEDYVVKLIASPDVGWEVYKWEAVTPSDLPIENGRFRMPPQDVTIKARFYRCKYAINVFNIDGGGGPTWINRDSAIYGERINLGPSANPGYEFDRWAVLRPAGFEISGNIFYMPASDVDIVAMFRKQVHEITIDRPVIGGVSVTVDASHRSAASGDVVMLAAWPPSGYAFDRWVVDSPPGLTVESNGRLTMPNSAVTVRPTFSALSATERSITVQSDGHGIAAVVGGRSSAAPGAQITLTPSPDPGYEFDRWVVPDGLGGISNNGFTMPDWNVVVLATFKKKVHAITVDPGNGGTAKQSQQRASSDDVVTLMPVPRDDFMFASWDIMEPKGLVITDGNQFTMPNAPVRVRPIFTPLPLGTHAIVVGSDGNGTGTPDPRSAKSGDVVTLTPTANDGYLFEGWNVLKPASDLVISDDGTFAMPDSDVFINATFRKIPASPTDPTVTLHNVDGGGKGTATPNQAAAGTEITLKPYAKDGYVFDRWVVLAPQGLVISGDKFKMPSSDVSIVAVFKEIDEVQSSSQTQTPLQVQGLHTDAIVPDKSDGILSSSAGQDMTIYLDVDFSKFTGAVSLDGVPLVMDTATVSRDFGARPGSTVITIWERTLKEKIKTDGEHSAEVIFDDGTAVHKFTVRGTGSGGSSGGESSSGGSSSGGGGCATMGAAVAVITAIASIKRRKR